MGYKQDRPIPVIEGGTENVTLTDHSVLVGSGVNPITQLTVGTDGQVLIGASAADPAFATLTSTGGTISFTPGPNSLNLEAVGGGGVSIKVTTFNASGMWTKDANTDTVTIVGWNGGDGGGSGRRGATTAAGGGAGGNAGSAFYYSAPANFFGATETVTIGAGGTGGTAQTVDNTDGVAGSAGGESSFGNVSAHQISAGAPGGTTTTAANALVNRMFLFVNQSGDIVAVPNGGGGSNVAPTNPTNVGVPTTAGFGLMDGMSASGGGGGSGADSGTVRQAARGGNNVQWGNGSTLIAGGTGGIESGTINGGSGNTGITTTGGRICGGTGGGGGGGQSSGAAAGTGGNGGFPGGGGGGGGGSLNGTNSGAGGNGGDGLIIVIEYL